MLLHVIEYKVLHKVKDNKCKSNIVHTYISKIHIAEFIIFQIENMSESFLFCDRIQLFLMRHKMEKLSLIYSSFPAFFSPYAPAHFCCMLMKHHKLVFSKMIE